MLEKASKMSTREAIAVLAGPYTGNRNSWLAKAARSVDGVSFRTMRSLWHNEIKDENHLAAITVRRQAEIIGTRRDAAKLAATYHRAAQALTNIDEDFPRNQIDALVNAARTLGALDGTGT